jgi:hypothetical protein
MGNPTLVSAPLSGWIGRVAVARTWGFGSWWVTPISSLHRSARRADLAHFPHHRSMCRAPSKRRLGRANAEQYAHSTTAIDAAPSTDE